MKAQVCKSPRLAIGALAQSLGVALWKGVLALCMTLCTLGLGLSRTANGATITTFDASGAGRGIGQGTFPKGINAAGAITGAYLDGSNLNHGFLRASDGTIITFDVPGSIATGPFSINAAGAITGEYLDASNRNHGFLRARDGTITTFDVPGAISTAAFSINPEGAIAGQ